MATISKNTTWTDGLRMVSVLALHWLCAISFLSPATAFAEAPPELAQLVEQLNDRTPLGEQPELFRSIVEQVDAWNPEELAEAAQDHASTRAQQLSESQGEPVNQVPIHNDLMRFPQANLAAAIALDGIVGSLENLSEELPGHLAWITPRTEPGTTVALYLPPSVDPPAEGSPITATGVFIKRLLKTDGETETVAPLIVARAWQPRQANDADAWSVVRDRSLGIQASEAMLYYETLAKAKSTPPAELRRQARDYLEERTKANPQWVRDGEYWMFKDLIDKPEESRGKPVTLIGYAREVRSYPAGENSAGIEDLYEIWIFTDLAQSNPAVIVTDTIPSDLPLGDDLQIQVRATGYFFKLYGYHAVSSARIAPLILAGPVEVIPPHEFGGFPLWLSIPFLIGALAILFWIVKNFFHKRRPVSASQFESVPDFGELREEDPANPPIPPHDSTSR